MVIIFDEQYKLLLWKANLLGVANIVHRGLPVFNTTTIMMMVDRWKSDTHSFHLPLGLSGAGLPIPSAL
jgi:hypothetical protein